MYLVLTSFPRKIALALSFFFILIALIGCNSETKYLKNSGVFDNYTDEFHEKLFMLDSIATKFKLGKTDLNSLKNSLKATRLAYKKIEFWIAYRYPGYAKSRFNGAPLLHIEKSGSKPAVLPPKGLQVLDELVFSDEAVKNRVKIAALVKMLKNDFGILYSELRFWNPPLPEILNAMRMQLVRIFTLGITGFDTPGSLNVLPEAKASLLAMHTVFLDHPDLQQRSQVKAISTAFKEAVQFVSVGTFENFDRLKFLVGHIDPLYRILGKLKTGPQRSHFALSTAWNPNSSSIFADDFLNPYFFTELSAKEDDPTLRSLGKKLFYDPEISSNGKMSCATCHQPEMAFTDGQPRSLSNVHGKTVLRNAPTLLNVAYADRFFYDLRAYSLEQQVEHVIFDPLEFNTAYREIIQKLKLDEEYAQEFEKVFDGNENNKITRENFTKALASYVLSLHSFNSKFDQYVRGEIDQIAPSVKNGFNLFMGKANCATCHFPPVFSGLVPPFYTDSESEILGALENPNAEHIVLDRDPGRYESGVSSEQAWIYQKSFKTMTVRNIELTAPYFHNGAYQDLMAVMDFYNKGGGAGMGLEVANQTLSEDPLNLTEKEISDLIAFMKSLTDNPFSETVKNNS